MIPFIFGQAQAPAAPPMSTSLISMLPMFAIIIVIFYFIVYRPQQREQKRRDSLVSSLKKGDKVITAGGIHGIIAGVKDDVAVVKVDENVKLEVSKTSITVVKK